MTSRPLDLEPGRAIVLEDNADPREDAFKDGEKPKTAEETLVTWVVTRTDEWRNHRNTNFGPDWDRYERLWRGMWSAAEKIRGSERSKFVSPALSEAVEVSVSEIEEAVFGRGDFFDFKAEQSDPEPFKRALDKNKQTLREDLGESDFVTNVSDCLINAAVFGTGIGEIITKTETRREIYPTLAADGTPEAAVEEFDVDYSCLRAVNPRNFLIQPDARNIKEALGVAIEENVGLHIIREGQADGSFNEGEVEPAKVEEELGADPQKEQETTTADTAHVIRYYGLVPKRLLFPPDRTEELDLPDANGTDNVTISTPADEMTEAVVVIANKKTLLKAVENPSLMKDRPVVAFQWDTVPGRFWGRGVCEKGEMPQRLLDTELRSRIDALAFTGAPMMGVDASRLPRGFKFEVAPGKSILVSGDPSTALKPFTFGQLDQNTWQQGQMLDQMVQRSTGAMNTTQMAQNGASGDARTGAVSMSLAGVVKRMKRSLMRFTDQFFIPALKKILWRNMQYAPERYIPMNSTFSASTTMGIMQREYEMLQLTQLLQAVQPGGPAHSALLKGVIAHTGLQNRREIMDLLDKQVQAPAVPPVDPMTMQLEQAAKQLQLAKLQAEVLEAQARTQELQSRAVLNVEKAKDVSIDNQLEAHSISMKGIYNTPEDQMQAALVERGKMADRMLEAMRLREDAAERVSNERIVQMQTSADVRAAQLDAISTVADSAAQAHVADNPAPVAPAVPI